MVVLSIISLIPITIWPVSPNIPGSCMSSHTTSQMEAYQYSIGNYCCRRTLLMEYTNHNSHQSQWHKPTRYPLMLVSSSHSRHPSENDMSCWNVTGYPNRHEISSKIVKWTWRLYLKSLKLIHLDGQSPPWHKFQLVSQMRNFPKSSYSEHAWSIYPQQPK